MRLGAAACSLVAAVDPLPRIPPDEGRHPRPVSGAGVSFVYGRAPERLWDRQPGLLQRRSILSTLPPEARSLVTRTTSTGSPRTRHPLGSYGFSLSVLRP